MSHLTAEAFAGWLAKVTPLLRPHLGDDVRLHRPRLIKDGIRCAVVRCAVTSARGEATSVILKRMKSGPDAGRGFTDWASLAFLSSVPKAQGITPRLYGGDVDEGIYAIEDLGGSRSLEDLLMGHDLRALEQALGALALQSARLHAHTMGREEEFACACRPLPEAGGLGRQREAAAWLDGRPKIDDWFAAVRCPLPAGFDQSVARIADLYAEPGPFLAFTHGDPAPTNNHIAGEDVRLLDFEFGGYRHALYDLTAWHVLCPLPENLVQEMSQAYRAALAVSCPAAEDERAYQEAWAHLCAYRALAMLTWIPSGVLDQNQPWVGDWSCREAVLAAVGRLQQATIEVHALAPVAEAAAGLEKALRSRWPEYGEVLPRWPALLEGRSSGMPGGGPVAPDAR